MTYLYVASLFFLIFFSTCIRFACTSSQLLSSLSSKVFSTSGIVLRNKMHSKYWKIAIMIVVYAKSYRTAQFSKFSSQNLVLRMQRSYTLQFYISFSCFLWKIFLPLVSLSRPSPFPSSIILQNIKMLKILKNKM